MSFAQDRDIIRRLAAELSDIAALPVQDEKRRLWRKLNGLKPERAMVTIDQVCFNEMNVNDELTLKCETNECRAWEDEIRRTLFQWKHFPADMVIEPFMRVRRAINGTGLGMSSSEEMLATDDTNSVVSHKYNNQIKDFDDLEKIHMPVESLDADRTARRMELAHALFDDIIAVREEGFDPYLSVWDPISTWMSVEDALYGMVDQPGLMHALVKRVVDAYMTMLDQIEAQGLLCYGQTYIHCTGAMTDELPAPGFNPDKPRTKDIWMFGLAQMLSTVSPAMYDEFEIDPCMPLFERFGLVYYGCCDPLDRKMKQVRKIKNARKISMSPWVNEELGAREIGKDYVYSRKPNPAFLAWPVYSEAAVTEHLQTTKDICDRHGCALEFILKDISTVGYQPERLFKWEKIAMRIAQS